MSGWDHNARGTGDNVEIAHQMRSTLAIIRARVQLMRRRQQRGGLGVRPTAADFAIVDAAIVRLVVLIERFES